MSDVNIEVTPLVTEVIVGGGVGPSGADGAPGPQGPPGVNATTTEVAGQLANGLAPLTGAAPAGSVLVQDGGANPTWRKLLANDLARTFAIELNGFSTLEIGESLVAPAINAEYVGGSPIEATLTDSAGSAPVVVPAPFDVAQAVGTFTRSAINDAVTFTVSAKVSDSITATADLLVTWCPRFFWGVDVEGQGGEAFILGLENSRIGQSQAGELVFNPSSQHCYFACPSTFTNPIFEYLGIPGGFTRVQQLIPVTNAHGVTVDYDLWCSDYALTIANMLVVVS